jgi:hypothetical protein
MKTLILTLFLALNLFASLPSIEENYKILNNEIEKISPELNAEEKISLHYHILSTHDAIVSSLLQGDSEISKIENISQKTLLNVLLPLYNDKLNPQSIEKIKTLYKNMVQDAIIQIEQKSSQPLGSLTIWAIIVTLGLLVGLFAGYLLFKNSSRTEKDLLSENILRELKKQNSSLLDEVNFLRAQHI